MYMMTVLVLATVVRMFMGQETPPEADHAVADDQQAARDTGFEKLLSGVQLVGFFTRDNAPSDASPAPDRYTITRVSRIRDGQFRFDAVIHYGGRDFPIAIALPVKWAGDTPLITLTDLAIPGMGVYTARVLFSGGRYAGTWSGGDHGGHLFGNIVPLDDAKESPAADDREEIASDQEANVHWPSFRGEFARGIANGFPTPTEWSVPENRNIEWKTPIPGLAHSSPIIWGDRLFVTSVVAVDEKEAELKVGLYGAIAPVNDEGVQRFNVYCLDKETGEVLWVRTAIETVPKVKRHPKGSHASSTPATDGSHIVAFFGSEGLYCYDMEGNLLWEKNLGVLDAGYYRDLDAQWGFGSSPVIHDGLVIVQCDIQKESFIAALSVADGSEVWRTDRDEVPTWGTPTIDVTNGRRQIIVNGWRHIGGYDLRTGAELWRMEGGGDIPVPTPIVAHDLIFITNAHGRTAPILAIDVDAAGTIESFDDERIAWSHSRRGNYMQTPIVVGEHLYLCHDAGVVTCYEARSGEMVYRKRLGGGGSGFTASPVAADGLIYFTSEDGEVYVVKAGEEFEILAVNQMGETCMASPAISQGTLFFRTRNHVVAIRHDSN